MTEGASQTDADEILLEYEAQIQTLTQENDSYCKGIQVHLQFKEQYDRLTEEYHEMKEALVQSQDNCHLLTLKLNASNYEIDLQNDELTDMRNELTELKSGWSHLNQEMNHLQADHRELQNKIAMDAESIQNMKGSKYKLQSQIRNLETENQLLHVNYKALLSIECRSCHRTISDLYHEQLHTQDHRPTTGDEPKASTFGEDAFDNLPDELSQTDEIRLTENRLLDGTMKEMVQNSRMMMNSSIIFKAHDKRQEVSPPPPIRAVGPKAKSMNSLPKSREKTSRLKSPKLVAVVLPSTCAECLKRVKGDPKILPTALQNLDQNSPNSPGTAAALSSEFLELGKSFNLLKFTHYSLILGFPVKKSYLDHQVVKRDAFGNQPGQNCVFCSWQCARKWNQKHTPVIQRYLIDQLISIAQGSFDSAT
jgi:predicted nuclease with TOPRIM domain